MAGDDSDSGGEKLRSARRVYDQQVEVMQNIDDKAMRTVRTAVLILGFVAAGLTSASPSIASSLPLLPVIIGATGVIVLFVTAFVGVGVYTLTTIPTEVHDDLRTSGTMLSKPQWRNEAVLSVNQAIDELDDEIQTNTEYQEFTQFGLLTGGFALLFAAQMTVMSASFGVPPWLQLVSLIVALALVFAGPALVQRLNNR